MTKEAKVGLLLGLFIIVGIAVVLRGVHQDSQGPDGELLTMKRVQPVLPNQSGAKAVKKLLDQTRRQQDAEVESGPQETLPDREAVAVHTDETDDEANEENEGDSIRFTQTLPGRSNTSDQEIAKVIGQTNEPMPLAVESNGPGVVIDMGPLKAVSRILVPEAKAQKYVVRDGDNLSKVALQVYGPGAGKRWVNVVKVFQANRDILSSMDMLRVGQCLKIPPVPGAMPAGRTELSGRDGRIARVGGGPAKQKVYVVKDGDNLWKIAAAQLGKGWRYVEVKKLNAAALRGDENRVTPGMRLVLPAE